MYINKAMVYGNLTRDPEMRALPSGQQVASFSLATNRVWKDKSGAKQESVDYHNIVMFDSNFSKLASLAAQYLKKGSGVFIEGRMQTRSWDDATGKKYRTEIVADTMQFGPRASGTPVSGGYAPTSSSKGSATAPVAAPEALETIEYPEEDINPDDIPF